MFELTERMRKKLEKNIKISDMNRIMMQKQKASKVQIQDPEPDNFEDKIAFLFAKSTKKELENISQGIYHKF